MTRLQAIRHVRKGWNHPLRKKFQGDEASFHVCIMIDNEDNIYAIFSRHGDRQGYWLNINPKQLLGFIKRNYLRK